MKYTLRILNGTSADTRTESDSVPRAGETVLIGDFLFLVSGVCHVIESDDGSNRGFAYANIVVLCEAGRTGRR